MQGLAPCQSNTITGAPLPAPSGLGKSGVTGDRGDFVAPALKLSAHSGRIANSLSLVTGACLLFAALSFGTRASAC